jgi:small-conductance mechanosensitive channel
MMKLPLRLTYDTDVEKVRKLIKKLGQQLLEDPVIGPMFMQPLKSQGVYAMEDSAMIVRVKFMTRPGDQFVTRKVIYSAIREIFEREGIHFAHREVTVKLADGVQAENLTPEQREAIAGSVRSVIDEEEAKRRALPDPGKAAASAL